MVLNLGNLGQINPTFLHRIFFNTYFMRINLCIIDRSTSEHGKVQQDRYCKKKQNKTKKTTQASTEIVLAYEQGLGIKSTTPPEENAFTFLPYVPFEESISYRISSKVNLCTDDPLKRKNYN